MDLIAIFIAGYSTVFALGFQSRNVNTGQYFPAAMTSFVIGISQAHIWTLVTSPSAGLIEAAVYGLSGAAGITSSMAVHAKLLKRKERKIA